VGDLEMRVWAAFLFTFAAVSDWFDGWYARRYNLITKFGKILDPIADKILVLGGFIAFSDLSRLDLYSFWWIVPIFLREAGITIYRIILLLQEKPEVVAASWSGKIKTLVQFLTLPCAYFYFMFKTYGDLDIQILYWSLYVMIGVSLAFTLYSGWRVIYKSWQTRRAKKAAGR
jgi:CDP-diacylglycerol--glycerol-3-phosphate 3-phosphatidyltransferase